MQVSLDGGLTWQDAKQGVYVTYDNLLIPGECDNGDLTIRLTHEGVIMDVWTDESNIGTSSEMADEIVQRLVDDNS